MRKILMLILCNGIMFELNDGVSDLSASHSCDKKQKLMTKSIINAIERIRMKHRRPSSEEIFYELKKENDMLSIEVFKDSLRKLEKKFIISKQR